MLATLRRHGSRHPPLTLLFTVREESGLWGSRMLDPTCLGRPRWAFNVDGPSPTRLVIGAVGGARWEAEVIGRAAHAGLHPERGISAALVVALALATAHRRGWCGRVRRGEREGTSNVGRLAGRDGGPVGGASNVVADYALVEGEARGHDATFVPRIVAGYRRAFATAQASVLDAEGHGATVDFRSATLYDPFRLEPSSDVVRFALERGAEVGLAPELGIADGALDANWIVRHGVPTITFGAGQRAIHTTDEYVDVPDYLAACRLAVALALA
jgi:tripeptide aminopeptidase